MAEEAGVDNFPTVVRRLSMLYKPFPPISYNDNVPTASAATGVFT